MEFTFETFYNRKMMIAMAKGVRKTLRKKKFIRSRIIAVLLLALVAALYIPKFMNEGFDWNFSTIITIAAVALIVIAILFEDQLNGVITNQRVIPGTRLIKTVFHEEGYHSYTDLGNTEWKYETVQAICESKKYFVFVFSEMHAQVYDKAGLAEGNVDEFREFIKGKIDKKIVRI